MINYDAHVHTHYSPCARDVDEKGRELAEAGRMLQAAAEQGLAMIAFTDHMVQYPSGRRQVPFYADSGPEIIDALRQEVVECGVPFEGTILFGAEIETLSTDCIGISRALARALDIVLVPTTHYHLPGVPRPRTWSPKDVADHMLDMLESVVRKSWIDVVAHPFAENEALIGDLASIFGHMNQTRLVDILGMAGRHGVALEINGSLFGAPATPHYAQVYGQVVQLAKACGVRFTYGSDAHQFAKVGMSDGAPRFIADNGLEDGDFLSLEEISARRDR